MTTCLASRRIKRVPKPLGLLAALLLTISFATTSHAIVKVTSVTGASNTDNVGTSTADTDIPVIFGGVTGTVVSSAASGLACIGDGLCNTCPNTPINTTPVPCNEEAITSATRIVIQFTAAKDGSPILTKTEQTDAIAQGTSAVAILQTAMTNTTWVFSCQPPQYLPHQSAHRLH